MSPTWKNKRKRIKKALSTLEWVPLEDLATQIRTDAEAVDIPASSGSGLTEHRETLDWRKEEFPLMAPDAPYEAYRRFGLQAPVET